MKKHNDPLLTSNPDIIAPANRIEEICESDTSLMLNAVSKYTDSVANDVEFLYNALQEEIRTIYGKFFLEDGNIELLRRNASLKPPNYIPNTEDIVFCRRKTTGIVEFNFTMNNNVNIDVFDGKRIN